ncbi:MAG TPA: dodecin flavoprotein [Hyphomonadaceae bacterium]|nr:dodecin flavoprotein [Hyphomonadaceae bacterium]
MSDHVYKSLELTGTSAQGVQAAIENAIGRASATVRGIKWFEVTQVRGAVEDGKVAHWQVSMKLGFTLED